MIVFLSGEGNTDIGSSDIKGPMAKLVEFNIKEKCNIEYELKIIHRKTLKNNKSLKLPGKKDNGSKSKRDYFFNNAYNLSKIIKEELKDRETELLLAVLFRDADTTEPKKWEYKYDSIVNGFNAGQCKQGIPMLPKTSSEVWLLGSVLKSHKMNGTHLEEIGDRDYLKEELKKIINEENVTDYNFAFSNIPDEISSYSQFKNDLSSVLKDY